jgi:ribosome-binding factor A
MSNRTHRSGARSPRAGGPTSHPGAPEGGAAGHRPHRLEFILREQLQSLLRDEASDPALDGIRVVSLELSTDGGHARVAYAVEASLGDSTRIERASRDALGRATGFLRARLADLLDLKRLPTLTFTFVGVQQVGVAPGAEEGGDRWLA